jgi:hypothetical protein
MDTLFRWRNTKQRTFRYVPYWLYASVIYVESQRNPAVFVSVMTPKQWISPIFTETHDPPLCRCCLLPILNDFSELAILLIDTP